MVFEYESSSYWSLKRLSAFCLVVVALTMGNLIRDLFFEVILLSK
jgi:hypothetical protein